MTAACPCCGRAYPKPKPSASSAPVDLAQLSDAALRAHYAKIAHVEDIRFHCRLAAGRQDEAAWTALLATVEAIGGKGTPKTKRQYWALVQAQRERTRTYADEPHGLTGWTVLYAEDYDPTFPKYHGPIEAVGYQCPSIVRHTPRPQTEAA